MFGAEAINAWNITIDSREVIERIEYLESFDNDDLSEDETNELVALRDLASEGESTTDDWPYGATLVHDSYFTEYAKELAEDCYDLSSMGTFASYIDWDSWADDVKMDYTPVTFRGETFWTR